MIVPMKHVTILCLASEKDASLTQLRDLGTVHLDFEAAKGSEVLTLKGEMADVEWALLAIAKARKDVKNESSLTGQSLTKCSVAEILDNDAQLARIRGEMDALQREIALYEPYGDFDPVLAARLLAQGIDLQGIVELPDPLPRKRLSEMKGELSTMAKALAACQHNLAFADDASIRSAFPEVAQRLAFAEARELMTQRGMVAFITGWIPQKCCEKLRQVALKAGWGCLLRDPEVDEMPPTLLEPPKIFRSVNALFAGLGIAPAYTEADVTVPFMCYFSLFFAMLVGDGGYGAIFLAATLALRRKLVRSWFSLLMVFSTATIAWGFLSNTWFGAGFPFAKAWPSVQWLADPSYHHMMLLCFTIGVSHLMLARIWNGICKMPDSTCVAELGWAGILLFMYFVTNSIVGIFSSIPVWVYWVFAVSLIAVFGFTIKPSALKARGAELGMLPLNVMGALGDIISYVRLFAVGLASVKVAENFNSMALGLFTGTDDVLLKPLMAIAMVAILVVGHGLNLAMAGLSILVHAVRLNTLEFSNHKGVTWAGFVFRPFRDNLKSTEIRP